MIGCLCRSRSSDPLKGECGANGNGGRRLCYGWAEGESSVRQKRNIRARRDGRGKQRPYEGTQPSREALRMGHAGYPAYIVSIGRQTTKTLRG
jgi:hypothetical protein